MPRRELIPIDRRFQPLTSFSLFSILRVVYSKEDGVNLDQALAFVQQSLAGSHAPHIAAVPAERNGQGEMQTSQRQAQQVNLERPMAITINGEGGIGFTQRMMAQGGPAGEGKGEPGYL